MVLCAGTPYPLPFSLPNEKRKSNLDEFTPLPRKNFKRSCPPPPSANTYALMPKTARVSTGCLMRMETLCMWESRSAYARDSSFFGMP